MNAKIVKIKPTDINAISTAASVMGKGGVIIYPTESSYGMGADATNSKDVKRILKIKGRENKPISIIVSSVSMAKKYAQINKDALTLMNKFMPGRLTLVARKKNLPDALSKETVGFRIPPHAFSLALLKEFGKPITATSANKSGEPALYRSKDVIEAFGDSVDLIIDAGNLPRRQPSTIFDVAQRKILRRGPVKEKSILEAIQA